MFVWYGGCCFGCWFIEVVVEVEVLVVVDVEVVVVLDVEVVFVVLDVKVVDVVES